MFKKEDVKDVKAFLSEDVEFEGKLVFKGTCNINGKFKGEIFSENGILITGESAEISGVVEVKHLINKGKIDGELRCDKVENFVPGSIIGEIYTKSFFIQSGAIFDGKCSMLKERPEIGIDEIEEDSEVDEKIVKKIG